MLTGSERRGFTLIELLVVIAITALLIGILLPALSGARESGRRTACLSNQRQVGTGLLLYADDYGDVLPRESSLLTEGGWPFLIRPFLDDRVDAHVVLPNGLFRTQAGDLFTRAEYYKCLTRGDDGMELDLSVARPQVGLVRGHQVHYVNNGLQFTTTGGLHRSRYKKWTRLDEIERAAEVIYATEYTSDRSGTYFRQLYNSRSTDIDAAIFYDARDAGHITSATGDGRIDPVRHGNGANALFHDGHAGLTPTAELTSLRLWNDGDVIPPTP